MPVSDKDILLKKIEVAEKKLAAVQCANAVNIARGELQELMMQKELDDLQAASDVADVQPVNG